MLKGFGAIALAALLAACTTPAPRTVPPRTVPPRTVPPRAAPPPALGRLESMPPTGHYRIDPQRSELRVLVYRAGPLANFGHNHVMVNRGLSGGLTIGGSLESSGFDLSIPVAQFVVDDSQARREEGEDFSGEVSERAREGTLHNMLSAALLNADRYPTIEVRSERLQEIQGSRNAIMALRIAGHEVNIAAPFVLSSSADGFAASASFELRHTELGIVPLSLMAGALQVRDAIRIKLNLTALPGEAPPPGP